MIKSLDMLREKRLLRGWLQSVSSYFHLSFPSMHRLHKEKNKLLLLAHRYFYVVVGVDRLRGHPYRTSAQGSWAGLSKVEACGRGRGSWRQMRKSAKFRKIPNWRKNYWKKCYLMNGNLQITELKWIDCLRIRTISSFKAALTRERDFTKFHQSRSVGYLKGRLLALCFTNHHQRCHLFFSCTAVFGLDLA